MLSTTGDDNKWQCDSQAALLHSARPKNDTTKQHPVFSHPGLEFPAPPPSVAVNRHSGSTFLLNLHLRSEPFSFPFSKDNLLFYSLCWPFFRFGFDAQLFGISSYGLAGIKRMHLSLDLPCELRMSTTRAIPENRGIQKMEIHFFPQKIISYG